MELRSIDSAYAEVIANPLPVDVVADESTGKKWISYFHRREIA